MNTNEDGGTGLPDAFSKALDQSNLDPGESVPLAGSLEESLAPGGPLEQRLRRRVDGVPEPGSPLFLDLAIPEVIAAKQLFEGLGIEGILGKVITPKRIVDRRGLLPDVRLDTYGLIFGCLFEYMHETATELLEDDIETVVPLFQKTFYTNDPNQPDIYNIRYTTSDGIERVELITAQGNKTLGRIVFQEARYRIDPLREEYFITYFPTQATFGNFPSCELISPQDRLDQLLQLHTNPKGNPAHVITSEIIDIDRSIQR